MRAIPGVHTVLHAGFRNFIRIVCSGTLCGQVRACRQQVAPRIIMSCAFAAIHYLVHGGSVASTVTVGTLAQGCQRFLVFGGLGFLPFAAGARTLAGSDRLAAPVGGSRRFLCGFSTTPTLFPARSGGGVRSRAVPAGAGCSFGVMFRRRSVGGGNRGVRCGSRRCAMRRMGRQRHRGKRQGAGNPACKGGSRRSGSEQAERIGGGRHCEDRPRRTKHQSLLRLTAFALPAKWRA